MSWIKAASLKELIKTHSIDEGYRKKFTFNAEQKVLHEELENEIERRKGKDPLSHLRRFL